MKRRTFIRNGGLAVASAFCLPGLTRAEKKAGQVAWVEGDSPYQITKKAIALLGGMAAFVSRQDLVMVKPNIAWNRTVEQAANTNPEVVRALVEMALEAGARKVIVMDNSTHRAVDAYKRSGIEETARRAGAEVRHVDENRLVSYDFKGESVKNWPLYRDFLEVDKFINVPILKHHGSSQLTIAMKNLFGIIGGNRGRLHRDLPICITDLANGFRSHLTVVDAYRVLMRNGPVGGRVSDVETRRTVIASANVMEADVAATQLFGLEPGEVTFLDIAHQRGMGEIDFSKLNLLKASA